MFLYSSLLAVALVVSAPRWLWRMLTSNRYRAGLRDRLGILPRCLDDTIAHRGASSGLIWLHAVSVGEVLAAERLIAELPAAFPGYQIVVSTTTATGNAVARQKLNVPVFYFPLDFAFAVRPYLRALRPTLILLVESELWPRFLHEAKQSNIPVAVVNARVSDRSFRRTMPFRRLWLKMARHVTVFLAQSKESGSRLVSLGVRDVQTVGNLKYEQSFPPQNAVAARLRILIGEKKLLVAGSTLPGEEDMLLKAWQEILRLAPDTVLILAPRHPQRFAKVLQSPAFIDVEGYRGNWSKDVSILDYEEEDDEDPPDTFEGGSVILLDTVGDLTSVYSLATVAFVGGSLVRKGGHNPLEPARFGVPVVMGPSYENFRDVVEEMIAKDAITIVQQQNLAPTLSRLLMEGRTAGANAKLYVEAQSGSTDRTLNALKQIVEHPA